MTRIWLLSPSTKRSDTRFSGLQPAAMRSSEARCSISARILFSRFASDSPHSTTAECSWRAIFSMAEGHQLGKFKPDVATPRRSLENGSKTGHFLVCHGHSQEGVANSFYLIEIMSFWRVAIPTV
jgi:hypothetical protein